MTFAHDTEVALVAAAALVNTASGATDTAAHAATTSCASSTSRAGSAAAPATRPSWSAVRALRPRLRELWQLEEAELVAALNAILAEADALPQLVDHDGLGWHIHAVPQDAPLATRMAVEAAMAFIDVVRAGELDRLKTCAADDCDDVVVDLSRNRSKRFCESGCGNRENVRAYRDRQTGEPSRAGPLSARRRGRLSRRWRTTSRANSTPEVIVSTTATASSTAETHHIRSPRTSSGTGEVGRTAR